MSRGKIAVVALSIMLVASNAFWAYNALDAGITMTYAEASFQDTSIALDQSLAVAKAASAPHASRESIVAAARAAGGSLEPFEKDGYLWVGRIGLKFDDGGRLMDVCAGDCVEPPAT